MNMLHYSEPSQEETSSSIALACVISPAVFPNAMQPLWGKLETEPKALQEEIESWRATPVGIWALAYFEKHCKNEYWGPSTPGGSLKCMPPSRIPHNTQFPRAPQDHHNSSGQV